MRLLVFLTLLVPFSPGCGPLAPVQAPVSGKVTLNGQPLGKGAVNFESVDKGAAATGLLQQDGSYSLRTQHGEGLPVGKYKVSIAPPPMDQPKPGAPPAKVEPSPIPEKYRNSATSGLVADVQRGGGPYNFHLKD